MAKKVKRMELVMEGKKADLYILFGVMDPSEIERMFPEYSTVVRKYYMQWQEARERVMGKLTMKEMAKRVFFGAEQP